ncbi:rRNA maturation RNase YbeY [Crocinitomicaceae bacterium]|nr:rRNA maturation RNase YbeY [Crocinitomicaceae bacterium]
MFFTKTVHPLTKHSKKKLEKTTQLVEKEGFKKGELSVIFCSDDYLLSLNNTYLNHDYFTDIITFSYNEEGIISGDLFISVDRTRDNAEKNNVSISNELARLVIHGMLHLCGFNDKAQEEIKVIRNKEEEYLKMFGFT